MIILGILRKQLWVISKNIIYNELLL